MMLTSFLKNSRPINYVIIGILLIIFGVLNAVFNTNFLLEIAGIPKHIGILLLWLFSMLLLYFILRKNQITSKNTFGIFVFVCTLSMFPLLGDWKILIALLLLLLAIRRILSLFSSRNREKKILDASLYILLASFFYFWCILMLIPLFVCLFQMPYKKLRYFFIPGISLLGIVLIFIAYTLIVGDNFQWATAWMKPISINYQVYGGMPKLLIAGTYVLALFIWAFFHRFSNRTTIAKKQRPIQQLISLTAMVLVLIPFLSNEKNGSEFIFWAISASFLIAPYLEKKSDLWFRELVSMAFLALPVILLFL